MSYNGIVLDVDGTVVRGDEPIPGAAAGLAAVSQAGLDRVFLSNNPTKRPAAYESRFETAGFDVDREEVFTAGTITTEYLRSEHADDRLFVIGDPGLDSQLLAADLSLTDDPEAADALVASMDREFGYQSLCDAIVALDDEIPFIGTDPDMLIPQTGYNIPGTGAMLHAIEGVTDREVDVICGKPSDFARRTVLDYLGCPPEECLVVGDRLNTDIELGAAAGMTTVLVRTGITNAETLADSPTTPDYVLDSLAELEAVLDGHAD
ncbi:HAD-IIA family hydrolase [Halohasta litorea]|uniref:HAD-IIA family hydrolase n=1 Tax=Halohasta litorea TaxID=869891 RepID=A0ABD6D739_9EURY|nr:HAD-IIA family hydrolase [Halohasta litorea]MEA1931080.1 HAD-IIA family hydrolase [Euryarchaeota archaeon]